MYQRAFTYSANPARIVFGEDAFVQTGTEMDRVGWRRALVLSTPAQQAQAEALAGMLGPKAAGVFPGAAMHTPVDVTARAVDAYKSMAADCVVALGGGSTTGLGKAIALRTGAPQIVIPTTYAGSEVTPILGQTEQGHKTTLNSPEVLPEVVLYDPALSAGLPVGMSVTSGLNAMAHAIEGLYARDRNPVSSLMALEGLRAMRDALPRIVAAPGDPIGRSDALYGAWLCGSVLGTVGMALHHKLCHTLGGSFDLPHAETHAILLPHTAAFNEAAAVDELRGATVLFGGSLGAGLYDFAERIGAPRALRDIGFKETDIARASDLALEKPYWNPRKLEHSAIRALLRRAWEGASPE